MKGRQLHLFNFQGNRKITRNRTTVNLPLDTLILLGIIIGLLLTIAFSLGVEKGRKIALKKIKKDQAETQLSDQNTYQPSIEETSESQDVTETPDLPILALEVEEENQQENLQNLSQKYIIQVATYVTQSRAKKEAEKLKSIGYPVLIAQKDKFVVLSVGKFDNKTEAKKKMSELKATYADCFLKTLK